VHHHVVDGRWQGAGVRGSRRGCAAVRLLSACSGRLLAARSSVSLTMNMRTTSVCIAALLLCVRARARGGRAHGSVPGLVYALLMCVSLRRRQERHDS
jgi:hypothetical protein